MRTRQAALRTRRISTVGRIRKRTRDEAEPEVQAIYDLYQKERGNVPNMFQTMAHRPDMLKTMIAHFRAVMSSGTLPQKLKEMAVVRTSWLNRCAY